MRSPLVTVLAVATAAACLFTTACGSSGKAKAKVDATTRQTCSACTEAPGANGETQCTLSVAGNPKLPPAMRIVSGHCCAVDCCTRTSQAPKWTACK